MKLLVVGPDIRDFRRVKNFTGVQAYYLARELRKRGIELQFVDGKHHEPLKHFTQINGQKCDHALVLGLRWFTHKPPGCAAILKTKVNGAVTQLHDGLVHESLAEHLIGVDCTFTFRDDSSRTKNWERYAKTNHYIGWAADPDVLYPQQSADVLTILIDHCYYKGGTPDVTAQVTKDVMGFVSSNMWRFFNYQSVLVRRLVNGGAETITPANVKTESFDRKHIPFEDIAREYRQTHVYMVTHKESVGLTCLELGFCGALTVAPNGMIYQDRLDTIRHLTYDGTAPWGVILDGINIRRSAEKARLQSWDKVVDRMLEWFGDFK